MPRTTLQDYESDQADGSWRQAVPHCVAFILVLTASVWLLPMALFAADSLFGKWEALENWSAVVQPIVELLLVWPQLVLVPYGFILDSGESSRYDLAGGISVYLAVGFWITLGAALGWAMRRKKLIVTALITLPLAVVVTKVVQALLNAFGIRIYLEWP